MSSIGPSQQAPLASGSCVHPPTSHATTGSPSTPESGPPSNPRSKNSPQELFRLKHNSLASAMGALRQITAALRLVKGRKEMATKATLKQLTNFFCESHSLVRMMKGSPLGLESSPLPELAWASTVDGPEERTDQSQNLALVNEGWDYCKLTWDLLNNPWAKHKAQFCANLSLVFLDLFRERCYNVWNTVEEACPSLGKKKQSRCLSPAPELISGAGGSLVCNLRRARLPCQIAYPREILPSPVERFSFASRHSTRITTPVHSTSTFVQTRRDSCRSLRQPITSGPSHSQPSPSQKDNGEQSSTHLSSAGVSKSKSKRRRKNPVSKSKNKLVQSVVDITQDSDAKNSKVWKQPIKKASTYDNIRDYLEAPYYPDGTDSTVCKPPHALPRMPHAVRTPTNGVRTAGLACGPAGYPYKDEGIEEQLRFEDATSSPSRPAGQGNSQPSRPGYDIVVQPVNQKAPKDISSSIDQDNIMTTKRRGAHLAIVNDDYNFHVQCFMAGVQFFDQTSDAPKTYSKAMKDPQADSWKQAINSELSAMDRLGVWEVVDIPKGCDLLNTVWIFQKKFDEHRKLSKFKARLCAAGNFQVEGIDYTETYAPTGRPTAL
ncbi:hypothetical protein PCASD_09426 [Puccinia coronata f. sp. avenae]|uniref:Reverse transcriptase Ty1/copia-type domain-containing protein n=1 Tax=Puccinia coronata f. sp. avenae TaxID=200324 RepID=A0A2N5UHV7_9BASI|nr:hypothetical protein PCASD_09426 [Puccinia coronata f. sp. avenae]